MFIIRIFNIIYVSLNKFWLYINTIYLDLQSKQEKFLNINNKCQFDRLIDGRLSLDLNELRQIFAKHGWVIPSMCYKFRHNKWALQRGRN